MPSGVWHRRILHVPFSPGELPSVLEKLPEIAAVPPFREPRQEADGRVSVEEFRHPELLTLNDFLSRAAAPLWVFVSIVEQSLEGLEQLHVNGWWHGALSAETLLVHPAGQVLLTHPAGVPFEEGGRKAAVARDLRDLALVFRQVLGGDPDRPMTVSRPDIAPMVAEWVDWLAAPAPGREPQSAAKAAAVFSDVRAGRAGLRPWQTGADLSRTAKVEAPKDPLLMTPEQRAKLRRAAARAHGTDTGTLKQFIMLTIIIVLLGGAVVVTNFYFADKANTAVAPEQTPPQMPGGLGAAGGGAQLSDETSDLFIPSGEDSEPLADTGESIRDLMKIMGVEERVSDEEWKALMAKFGLQPRREGVKQTFTGNFGYVKEILPAVGQESPGREPGDYYLVWRTNRIVLTPEESAALQSALLRCARFCGVRVLAWTVLPNQAAAVVRVPERPRFYVTDEKLARRIAILQGDKMKGEVIAAVNARLKAGDPAGADGIRRQWTSRMGTAAGFYNEVKGVAVVDPALLPGVALWEEAPLHLRVLNPEADELFKAVSTVDTAAIRAELATTPSEWPLTGLRAAMHNYAPALRATFAVMNQSPRMAHHVPRKQEMMDALIAYRQFLHDLPMSPETLTAGPKPAEEPRPGQPPPERKATP